MIAEIDEYKVSIISLLYKMSLFKMSRLFKCDFTGNSRFINVLRCIVLLNNTLTFSHILLTHLI